MAIKQIQSPDESDLKSRDDQQAALAARRTWLRKMGLTDEEIETDIREHPLDLHEEQSNLSAIDEVQKLNESSSGKHKS